MLSAAQCLGVLKRLSQLWDEATSLDKKGKK
jgi:hypothetical protein